MRIIFWAESLNMHTSCMFEELGKLTDVTAVYYNRGNRDFGDLPLRNIKLVKISNREEADKIIDETKDCIHVNRALKLYDNEGIIIFNYALRRMLKENYFVVSLYLEQYYYWGIKGLLRRLKWGWLFNFGYARKLKALGCCGYTGVEAHRKAFVPRKKLFDFIYTVPTSDSYLINTIDTVQCDWEGFIDNTGETHPRRFVFVGQLRERKSIIELINVFNSIDSNYELYVIGDGPQKNEVVELIENNDRIRYLGKLKPIQVRQVLCNSDVLVLPSKLEGWGCVVNEALMSGCKVIVSSIVGARALIGKHKERGQIFKNLNWSDLRECLVREINSVERGKVNILSWSQNITPKREAEYFLEILDYLQGKTKQRPLSPWD